ncbi:unnamed protein product, partial [Meganyctiphanes norvegica]
MCPSVENFVQVTDLHAFANRIKGDIPYSASLYNSLLIHARGLSSQFEFYTHKDNPDDSHIIMSRNKDQQRTQDMVLFHCLQGEASLLLKALRETQLVNWHKNILFNVVPDFLIQELQQIIQEKVEPEANITNYPGNKYMYAPGVEV